MIDERNERIKNLFEKGTSIEELAREYFLSAETIKKIVYKKQR